MVQRRKVIIGVLGASAGLTVAGCSGTGNASTNGASGGNDAGGPAATASTAPTATPISLTVSPKAGTAKVSPADPVTVAVDGGTLKSVTVAAGSKKVSGAMESDGVSWRSTGELAYGKTYRVTASIQDSTGAAVEKTSTFTTLKPAHQAGVTFQANAMGSLRTGGTYGMGQPVIVAFSHAVSNKAAAEKAITIETSPSVEGKFYWASSSIVHWRPAKYWAKGSTIKVSVNAYGVHLGSGVYGKADA